MSAIFGILNVDGSSVQDTHLHMMHNQTAQYGRDGADIFTDRHIALGCCLSKFGARSQGDVPVYSDEAAGLTLVCDALLWNRTELMEALKLDNGTATQGILLAAYKAWGGDCPKHINGDFAFAVWDHKKQRLFLARDHLGVRPLYYFWDGQTFAFATDIRAVLCLPFVGKQLNEVKLYALLAFIHRNSPETTYFEQIKHLPQAHTLCIGADGLHKAKYWTPGLNKIRYQTEEEYKNALYDIVNDAVKRRIHGVAGGIGAELSGGLDSSVVTVLAARKMKEIGKKPYLVSWEPSFAVYPKQPRDDRDWIERICRQEDLHCEYLDKTASAETAPADNESDHPLHRELRRMVENNANFILSGWGGDEGISRRSNPNELFRRGAWGHFLREIARASKGNPLRFAKRLFSNTVMPLFAPFAVFWKAPEEWQVPVTQAFYQKMKRVPIRDPFYFKINPARHIQTKVAQSRTTLSASLDSGFGVQHLYPFLDFRVVDFAMSIPCHLFYQYGRTRYIFCEAFDSILPDGLCRYPTKADLTIINYRNTHFSRRDEAKAALARIDRTLFSPYLDFDKLDALVADAGAKKTSARYAYTLLRLQECIKIQRCLEDKQTQAASSAVSI